MKGVFEWFKDLMMRLWKIQLLAKVDNSLGELGWDLDLHKQKQHLMIYLSFNDGKR